MVDSSFSVAVYVGRQDGSATSLDLHHFPINRGGGTVVAETQAAPEVWPREVMEHTRRDASSTTSSRTSLKGNPGVAAQPGALTSRARR